MIEVKNVSYFINKKTILNNVSAKFETGRITVIIGANGAGKSTLLRALCNLINYDGEIFIDGENIKNIDRKLFAQKIGVLPQNLEAPKDLTVEELAYYGRHPYRSMFFGEDENTAKKAVDFALKAANIATLKNRRLRDLSGGERQRANLSMVLAGSPKILLLDEPTTYLDISHQLEVMEIVKKLNIEKNLTVIMVLHDLNHALNYADNVVIMKEGKIYRTGEPNKTLTKESILEVFNVDSEILKTKEGNSVIFPKKPLFF